MNDNKPEWIDIDFLGSIDREVEAHPSFNRYMSQVVKGIRYYSSTDEWWVPIDEHEDMDISETRRTARENRIYETVNELNSILLKNDPIVRTHPFHPEDAMFSDDMDSILLAAWRNAKTADKLRSALKMAQISGMGVLKTGWNMASKYVTPAGEVAVTFRSPTDVWFDPYASNANRALDCRYIRDTSYQTPEAIIYRYGHDGAVALEIEAERGRHKKWDRSLGKIRQKIVDMVSGTQEDGQHVDRRFPVYEYWIFPVHGKESELTTGEMVDEKTYPYGLVVTRIKDKIVRVIPNPYYKRRRVKAGEGLYTSTESVEVGHRMHPFVVLFWGREMNANGYNGIYDCKGMVQEQIPLQTSLDFVNRDLEQHIATNSWPGAFILDDAFEDPIDRIEGRPGELIRINAMYASQGISNVVQQFQGRTMASEAWLYRNEKSDKIAQVAGLKPHMIGLAPQGTSHTPAATVGTLQEASFSAMWIRNDEITSACQDIALRYLGLIQQYYEPGRVVQISEEGGIASYVQIQSNHLAGMFKLEVVSGTTTPLYDMDKEVKLLNIKEQVDVALSSGSIELMKSALIYLDNLNNPLAFQWVQLLRQTIQELEMAQQTLQGMGGMALMEGAAQPALPPAQGEPGMEALAAALGTTPEEIDRVFSE